VLTDPYREDEIQALITLAELNFPIDSPNNNSYKTFPKSMTEAQTYFRRFRVDLSVAFNSLHSRGFVSQQRETWGLTPIGKEVADQIRKVRPPIYYWYKDYYSVIDSSDAFSEYSRRVFGKNLGQHGFSDLTQIHMMLEIIQINASSSVLDIGCGNGKIAEYISDLTQASVTGIDYIPEAIEQAKKRTVSKRDRLHFRVGDIETPVYDNEFFDLILSIDSIYFNDPKIMLTCWKRLLKPTGKMAIFYLSLDGSDLSIPLKENSLSYDTYDLSKQNWAHQQLKHTVASEMREAFEAEGNLFVWKNLMMESIPNREAYDPTVSQMRRYLYIVNI
jgi:SAM-dependent methyltransferase